MNDSIGRRLSGLRIASGLSQAAVAEALDLHPTMVSKIESGRRQLSLFELRGLAEAFGWDIRALLGIERPRAKMEVAARLRAADGSIGQVMDRAASVVEVDALLDEAGCLDQSEGILFASERPAPRTMAEAVSQGAEVAALVRDFAQIAGPVPDLFGLAERTLGVDVLAQPFPGGKCDGVVGVAANMALVVVDTSVVAGRQRFTLAHELGHALMGDVTDTVRLEVDGQDELVEERAQAFAANLLMPEAEFTRLLGPCPDAVAVTEAMAMFEVSWAAVKRRSSDLGITVDPQLLAMDGEQIFTLAGRSSDHAAIPAPGMRRMPSRIERRVRRAYQEAIVGAGVVSMAFGVTGEDLDELLSSMPVQFVVPEPADI
jgi:transcriptional regulator with XRE-family HTH domain